MGLRSRLLKLGIDARDANSKVDFPGKIVANNVQEIVGDVFYVDNTDGTDDSSHGHAPGTSAFKTLDYAIGKCAANNGDVIYLCPGHTENVTGAAGITCDIAGVTIIGLGSGSLKPKFTFTTADTATILVSAANVTFQNVDFSANFADVAKCFDLTTAKYFTLIDCDFMATATDMNFLSIIDTNTTNNAADGLAVIGCSWIEPDTATLSFLDIDGDLDQLVFLDNYLNLGVNTNDLPAIAIVATGKDVTNVQIGNNRIVRLNDENPLLVTFDTTTANTGVVFNNYVRHLDTAGEILLTAGSNIGQFQNFCTAVINASGFLVPAADS